MLKKFLTAAALFVFAAASFATDYVRIDLNYYCRGNLKCLSPKQKGIQIVQRRDYPNGKHPDKCYYSITVNLDVVQEVDLVYEVVDTGDKNSAVIKTSLEPIRIVGGKRSADRAIECLELQVDDEISSLTPCVVTGWKNMETTVVVSKGDKISIKGKFKKAEK